MIAQFVPPGGNPAPILGGRCGTEDIGVEGTAQALGFQGRGDQLPVAGQGIVVGQRDRAATILRPSEGGFVDDGTSPGMLSDWANIGRRATGFKRALDMLDRPCC